MNIDPAWTPAGLKAAAAHDILAAEVIEVIDALSSIHLVGRDTIWYVGETSGPIITVICDRQARNTDVFEITNVRPAGRDEIILWESRQTR